MPLTTHHLSPAKINWFLHVLSRQPDGYHALETVFQRIDWCDELDITVNFEGDIVLTGDLCGVPESHNLAYRAALALRDVAKNDRLGAQIHLVKHIPTGAGLGGGSSNAATVLTVLNEAWQLGLSVTDLLAIARPLGADVPFFVTPYAAAFAQGIGDVLQPLALPARELLIVNPSVHVNTAAVFTHADLPRQHASLGLSLAQLQTQLSAQAIHPEYNNDLEPVTFALAAQVKAAHDALATLAPTRMSGSGASMMACPENEMQRQQLADWTAQCPAHWQWRWVRTLTDDATL